MFSFRLSMEMDICCSSIECSRLSIRFGMHVFHLFFFCPIEVAQLGLLRAPSHLDENEVFNDILTPSRATGQIISKHGALTFLPQVS